MTDHSVATVVNTPLWLFNGGLLFITNDITLLLTSSHISACLSVTQLVKINLAAGSAWSTEGLVIDSYADVDRTKNDWGGG